MIDKTIYKLGTLLKEAGMEQEDALTVSLIVSRPGRAQKLIEWLEAHPKATHEEIGSKALDLA